MRAQASGGVENSKEHVLHNAYAYLATRPTLQLAALCGRCTPRPFDPETMGGGGGGGGTKGD